MHYFKCFKINFPALLLGLFLIVGVKFGLHASEQFYSTAPVTFDEIRKSSTIYYAKKDETKAIINGEILHLFRPYNQLASFLPSSDNVWVNFALRFDSLQTETFVLFLGGRYNNEVNVYVIDSNNRIDSFITGSYVPLSLQSLPNDRNYQKIKLKIKANESYSIYVHYRNRDKKPIVPDIHIDSLESWNNHISSRNITQGIFQGAIWMLLLYHLFIFLIGRENQYKSYIIYLLALSTYFLNYYSFLLEWFFPNSPSAFIPIYIISTSLVPISYLFFIKSTLVGDKVNILLFKMINGWIWVRTIESILMLVTIYTIFDFDLVHEIHRAFALFETFFFLFLMVFYKQTSDAASPFIIWGTIFLHIGIFVSIVSSSKWGLVEQGNYFFEVGALIEVFTFALGLGYRNRQVALAEREAHKNYIDQLEINETLTKERESTLQLEVAERTQELEIKKEELSILNGELMQLADVKDKMLAILSHDARLPLTNMRLMLELYQSRGLPENEMKTLMGEINLSIDQSIQLMENLIFWTKANSNGIKIVIEKTDISLTVYRVAEQLRPMFVNKNIEFVYAKQEPLFAYFDAYSVEIIIRNLIHNALKYTNSGGKVELRQLIKNEYVAIEISDNGTGIDESILEQFEENMLRKSTAGTNKESGTGLGLSLCYEFARLNKGYLEVSSKRNVGTNITLHLLR